MQPDRPIKRYRADDASTDKEEEGDFLLIWNERTHGVSVSISSIVDSYIEHMGQPRRSIATVDGRRLFYLLKEYTAVRSFASRCHLPIICSDDTDEVFKNEVMSMAAKMLVEIDLQDTDKNTTTKKKTPLGHGDPRIIVKKNQLQLKLDYVNAKYKKISDDLESAFENLKRFGDDPRQTFEMKNVVERYKRNGLPDTKWTDLRPKAAKHFFDRRDTAAQRFIEWWKLQVISSRQSDGEPRVTNDVNGTFYTGRTVGPRVSTPVIPTRSHLSGLSCSKTLVFVAGWGAQIRGN